MHLLQSPSGPGASSGLRANVSHPGSDVRRSGRPRQRNQSALAGPPLYPAAGRTGDPTLYVLSLVDGEEEAMSYTDNVILDYKPQRVWTSPVDLNLFLAGTGAATYFWGVLCGSWIGEGIGVLAVALGGLVTQLELGRPSRAGRGGPRRGGGGGGGGGVCFFLFFFFLGLPLR